MTVLKGTDLKKARTAAGLSQAALAEKTGVSVKDISKAERGLKDLTPEQAGAVGKVLGGACADALPDKKELLKLYSAAPDAAKKAAVAALKGEAPQMNPMAMLSGMMKGGMSKEMMSGVKDMIKNARVGDLMGMMKKFMGSGMLSGMMGGMAGMMGGSAPSGKGVKTDGSEGKEISQPLLAFTFFYSVAIYILLLSFYFWLWRRDIKPEK